MKYECESWGRYPKAKPKDIFFPKTIPDELPVSGPKLLAYGLGRSYGDVCQNPDGNLLVTKHLDHFISFDHEAGLIRCEPGVTLGTILEVVVSNGWFLPCTPGTQHVTIGGAVANDVHGKNHYLNGTFGRHVRQFGLLRSSGEYLECSSEKNPDMYRATIGGLGLTGLITWVEFQLMRIKGPLMTVKSRRFYNIDEFWGINDQAVVLSPYTVAWIDCTARGHDLGRGIYFEASHAFETNSLDRKKPKRKLCFPVDPPFSLVNSFNLKVFNKFYFRRKVYPEGCLQHLSSYFYPLDSIDKWNRMYGKSGFLQYQCVVPNKDCRQAIRELLETISDSGQGSFLAVLKSFGDISSPGMLSFPREGVTLALDFSNQGERTLKLLSKLDDIVREVGGALYPAKDSRMTADMFRRSFPEWEDFSDLIDPNFTSGFWQRVVN